MDAHNKITSLFSVLNLLGQINKHVNIWIDSSRVLTLRGRTQFIYHYTNIIAGPIYGVTVVYGLK